MNADVDRVKGALTAFVESITLRYRYAARYQCRVVGQNGDGTLELVPDDTKIPGLSGVPIYSGLAGVTLRVAAGARCLLEFAGGDPSRPIVTGWEPGDAVEISFNHGSHPVARVGDATAGHFHDPGSFNIPGVGSVTGLSGIASDSIAQGASGVKA